MFVEKSFTLKHMLLRLPNIDSRVGWEWQAGRISGENSSKDVFPFK